MDIAEAFEFPLRRWTEGLKRPRPEECCSDLADYPSLLEAAGDEDDHRIRLWLLETGLRIAWQQESSAEQLPRICDGGPMADCDFDRYAELAVLTLIEAGLHDHALETAKLLLGRNPGRGTYAFAAAAALSGDDNEAKRALETIERPGELSTTGRWGRAILLCSVDCEPAEIQQAVRHARAGNPYAEAMLSGPPVNLADAWGMPFMRGTRDEALSIAMYFQKPWMNVCKGEDKA